MNSLFKKLLAPRSIEYLILNQKLIILETSSRAQYLADSPKEVLQGKDIRLSFPEFIGAENILLAVIQGQRASFEIKGIARSSDINSPLYIDLYAIEHQDENTLERCLIILAEDVTEMMVLKQVLVQRANESELLLSSLGASKNYIDRIITSMADALFVTTALGIIKTVNPAAQSLFDYREIELVDQPISHILGEEFFLTNAVQQPLLPQGEVLKNREVTCKTKAGKEIIVEFSYSAVQAEIKDLYDFVYIGRDITEQKRAEVEINKALEKEKELNELKSRFLSIASHQFRTPLSTIRMSSELLEKFSHNLTEDKKHRYFHQIKAAIHQMTELMDDVLVISKAEAGKVEFSPKSIDLEQFCKNLVEDMQLSDGNQHILTFSYQGSCKHSWVDEKFLWNIFTNLLSNALKYSPVNSTIYFTLTCQDEAAIFEVKDQGIGIPPETQKRLFETFHRARNVGKISGTGLGLAIAKRYIDLHGGEIKVTSQENVGTTFTVTIPLRNFHHTSREA